MQHTESSSLTIRRFFFWPRRLFACAILLTVTWLSLADSNSLQQHEAIHFLTYCYHLTGIVIDKLAHFLMYFAVCGALWIALPARFYHIPSPLWAFLIATLWGLLMEVLQGVLTSLHIISRAFDLHDAVANLLGAAAASLCTSTLMLLWRHHHSTQNR